MKKSALWSTECPHCRKRIRHSGNIEIVYCPKCRESVDLFSPHNKHRRLR